MRTKSTLKRECEKVNVLLRREAEELRLGTKVSLARLDGCKDDLKAFSYWAKLEFQEYVRRTVEKNGSANAQALIYGGASKLKVNPETTKRYLRTLRAAGGPFAGLGETVVVNANYTPPEEDEYWVDDVVAQSHRGEGVKKEEQEDE